MSLASRISDLATAVRNKFNAITPRLTTWVKLAADTAANTNSNSAANTTLTFNALANTTYIVDFIGAFQSAATTTGIGLQLDVPAGAIVYGLPIHHANATQTLTGHEQVADAATVQATSGVRAINTPIPVRSRWIVEVGANAGAVTLQYKPEVNSSGVLLKKPSALGYRAI